MNKKDYAWYWTINKEYINKVYKEQNNPEFEKETNVEIFGAMKKYKKNTLLEIGCGWGRLMRPLQKKGYKIRGTDINKNYLLKAKNQKLKVWHSDIVKEALPELKSDVVFFKGVLMYMKKEYDLLEAIKHIDLLAKKKVIVFEWATVCERILHVINKHKLLNSYNWEFHPIMNEGLESYLQQKAHEERI